MEHLPVDELDDEKAQKRQRCSSILLLIAMFALIWLNWRFPVLRFGWQPLNQLIFLAALMIPIAVAALSFRFRPRWIGIPLAMIFSLVAVATIPLVLFGSLLLFSTISDGFDPSFEKIQQFTASPCNPSIYRTNGGATTSLGIVVRQELPILPGVLLVRNVFQDYPAADVDVKVISSCKVTFNEHDTVLSRAVWF